MTAINLREGDAIETMDGCAYITKIEKTRHEEPVPVYNFHVKEWASYFVGEVRVYVHNTKEKHGQYINKTSKSFWKAFNDLPQDIQKKAKKAYKIFKENPNHVGLNFEELEGGKFYSVRINKKYRAYGRKMSNGGIEWDTINGHDYTKAIEMLKKKNNIVWR